MKYTLIYTGEFKRNVKKCVKRGYDLTLLQNVISILQMKGELPKEYSPHKLMGNSKAIGNVMLCQIGYCSGNKMIKN